MMIMMMRRRGRKKKKKKKQVNLISLSKYCKSLTKEKCLTSMSDTRNNAILQCVLGIPRKYRTICLKSVGESM